MNNKAQISAVSVVSLALIILGIILGIVTKSFIIKSFGISLPGFLSFVVALLILAILLFIGFIKSPLFLIINFFAIAVLISNLNPLNIFGLSGKISPMFSSIFILLGMAIQTME